MTNVDQIVYANSVDAPKVLTNIKAKSFFQEIYKVPFRLLNSEEDFDFTPKQKDSYLKEEAKELIEHRVEFSCESLDKA